MIGKSINSQLTNFLLSVRFYFSVIYKNKGNCYASHSWRYSDYCLQQ